MHKLHNYYACMGRTTVAVATETRDALKRLGRKGESYDRIIRRLMARAKRRSADADASVQAGGETARTPRGRGRPPVDPDMDVV